MRPTSLRGGAGTLPAAGPELRFGAAATGGESWPKHGATNAVLLLSSDTRRTRIIMGIVVVAEGAAELTSPGRGRATLSKTGKTGAVSA